MCCWWWRCLQACWTPITHVQVMPTVQQYCQRDDRNGKKLVVGDRGGGSVKRIDRNKLWKGREYQSMHQFSTRPRTDEFLGVREKLSSSINVLLYVCRQRGDIRTMYVDERSTFCPDWSTDWRGVNTQELAMTTTLRRMATDTSKIPCSCERPVNLGHEWCPLEASQWQSQGENNRLRLCSSRHLWSTAWQEELFCHEDAKERFVVFARIRRLFCGSNTTHFCGSNRTHPSDPGSSLWGNMLAVWTLEGECRRVSKMADSTVFREIG